MHKVFVYVMVFCTVVALLVSPGLPCPCAMGSFARREHAANNVSACTALNVNSLARHGESAQGELPEHNPLHRCPCDPIEEQCVSVPEINLQHTLECVACVPIEQDDVTCGIVGSLGQQPLDVTTRHSHSSVSNCALLQSWQL